MTVPGTSPSPTAGLLCSVAKGSTEVTGFLEGEDDLSSTISAFSLIGVDITRNADRVTQESTAKGSLASLAEPTNMVNAGNSGTTTRLLVGLLSSLPFFSVMTGDASSGAAL